MEGTPVIECTGCHSFWTLGEFFEDVTGVLNGHSSRDMEFFKYIRLVQA